MNKDKAISRGTAIPTALFVVVFAMLSSSTALAQVLPISIEAACAPGDVRRGVFADVSSDNTHALAIDCMFHWQVTQGVGGDRYDPGSPVSREQMASFITRLVRNSGGNLPDANSDFFTDDSASVHQSNINALAAVGIASGKGAGIYAPGENVTRGQMVTFIVRAYEYRTGTTLDGGSGSNFEDTADSAHASTIDQGAEAGLAAGFEDGTFREGDPVRRDQMASFLARTLSLLVQEGYATPPKRRLGPPKYLCYLNCDVPSVDSLGGWDDGPVTINGQTFPNGLFSYHSFTGVGYTSWIEYDVGRAHGRFQATVGLVDTSDPQVETRFRVIDSETGVELRAQDVGFGQSVAIDVDITGVLRLRLEVTQLAGTNTSSRPAFGNAAVFAAS